MHLEFAKPEQARKALLKHHFKLFGRQMLAVEECEDIAFKSGGESKSGNGGGNTSAFQAHGGANASMSQPYSSARPRQHRPRPLVPMYSPMNGGTPRKSQGGGLLSYIFG